MKIQVTTYPENLTAGWHDTTDVDVPASARRYATLALDALRRRLPSATITVDVAHGPGRDTIEIDGRGRLDGLLTDDTVAVTLARVYDAQEWLVVRENA